MFCFVCLKLKSFFCFLWWRLRILRSNVVVWYFIVWVKMEVGVMQPGSEAYRRLRLRSGSLCHIGMGSWTRTASSQREAARATPEVSRFSRQNEPLPSSCWDDGGHVCPRACFILKRSPGFPAFPRGELDVTGSEQAERGSASKKATWKNYLTVRDVLCDQIFTYSVLFGAFLCRCFVTWWRIRLFSRLSKRWVRFGRV